MRRSTRASAAAIGSRTSSRNGRVIWIVGEFLVVDPPERLVFSWRTEPGESEPERVTVRFDPRGSETEVVVIHERVRSLRSKDEHAVGWEGCLEGLAGYASSDVQDRTV